MRFGKWDFIKNSVLPNFTIIIFFTTSKKIILDVEDIMTKKTARKKRQF